MVANDRGVTAPTSQSVAKKMFQTIGAILATLAFIGLVLYLLYSQGLLSFGSKEKPQQQTQAPVARLKEVSEPFVVPKLKEPEPAIIADRSVPEVVEPTIPELDQATLQELLNILSERPPVVTQTVTIIEQPVTTEAEIVKAQIAKQQEDDSAARRAAQLAAERARLAAEKARLAAIAAEKKRIATEIRNRKLNAGMGGGSSTTKDAVDNTLAGLSAENGGLNFATTFAPNVKASRIANMAMTLPKGHILPCTMNTRIQSDLPGLTKCVINRDVYGADGSVILIDKGSYVLGEYRNGITFNNQSRIYIIWGRLVTPTGVIVELNSPSAGPLGAAGVGGYVDRKFVKRLFNAVLFSAINDTATDELSKAGSSVRTETDQNGNTVVIEDNKYQNTADNLQSELDSVLSQLNNVRPIFYKGQGEKTSIIVARDIDFSTVYSLNSID